MKKKTKKMRIAIDRESLQNINAKETCAACTKVIRSGLIANTTVIDLIDVAEKGRVITLVSLSELLLHGIILGSLVFAVTALVFIAEVDGEDSAENSGHCNAAKQNEMAGKVARGFIRTEDKARDGAAEVTHTNLHGNTNSTLQCTADIVAVPGNGLRDVGVDTSNNKEAREVLDLVVLDTG